MQRAKIITQARNEVSYFYCMANTKQLPGRPVPEGFTRRSFAVFRLWAMLWSKAAIDRHLALSDHTADLDLRHVYILLNVHRRDAAVQKAWLEGIFLKEDFEGIEWRGWVKEDGSQKTEDRRRKSEDRSQKTEVRRPKTEVRSQKSEVRSQKTEDRSQKTEDRRRKSEVRSQKFLLPASMLIVQMLYCSIINHHISKSTHQHITQPPLYLL